MEKEERQEVSSLPKRRFVWPGELHHSFVSAVFDLGLRCATACSVASMLPNEEKNAEALVQHLLSKYREARCIEGGGSQEISPPPPPPPPRGEPAVNQRSVEIAQRQLDIAAKCENIVNSFRPKLRARHRELCDSLRLEEEYNDGRRAAARRDQHLIMESQMNLHRKMLNIKAAVEGGDNSPETKRRRISDLHYATSLVDHQDCFVQQEDTDNAFHVPTTTTRGAASMAVLGVGQRR